MMSDYTIDWDTTNTDETTTISDGGGHTVDVTVSTPDGGTGPGEEWNLTTSIGDGDGELRAYNVNDETQATIQFEDAMTDVTFELYDVDAGTNWDDSVTIYALDEFGNPTPMTIEFDDLNFATHTTSDDGTNYTLDASGHDNPNVEGSGAADSVTVTIPGPVYGFVIVYDNGESYGTSGVVGIGPISFDDPSLHCFVRGTMIETNRGDVAIEDLAEGDMIRTMDNGMQPIRWIGSSKVSAKGKHAPILIREGAIGNTSDLLVSPAHRVMLQGWQTELLFGNGEMLAAAKSLVNETTITRQVGGKVEYFHIMFDKHEIVFSNGAPTESYHPGEASVGKMALDTRNEIYSLFPALEANIASYGPSARDTLRDHEVALLNG